MNMILSHWDFECFLLNSVEYVKEKLIHGKREIIIERMLAQKQKI